MWGTGLYSTTMRKERLGWKMSLVARPWVHKCITVTTGKTSVSQKPQCKDTEKLFIECSTRNSYNRIGAKSDVEFKGDQCEHET